MWYAVRTGMEAFSMSEMRACFASSMLFFSVRRFLQKEEREREREREGEILTKCLLAVNLR